jgi:hypothetical protein
VWFAVCSQVQVQVQKSMTELKKKTTPIHQAPDWHHRQGTRRSHRPAGHLWQEPQGGDRCPCGDQHGAKPVHLQCHAKGYVGRGEAEGERVNPDFSDNLPLEM